MRATVNSIVLNFGMRPGDYVNASTAVFALRDTDSFYVAGYFQVIPGIHTMIRCACN